MEREEKFRDWIPGPGMALGSSLSVTALEATPPLHHRPSFEAPPAPAPFLASQDPCQDPASQCHTHVPKLDFIFEMEKKASPDMRFYKGSALSARQKHTTGEHLDRSNSQKMTDSQKWPCW